MDNLNVIVEGNHRVNEEKPPPRVCPRCDSDNTKFCYYNNYNVTQPRYNCKNCRRFWTHGGSLRDIPIGGRARKIKRAISVDQPYDSVIEHVNHHQPLSQGQENNEFLGTFGGSSSYDVVGNLFSFLHETNGDMVTPIRSIPPMESLGGSFNQGYNGPGFNDLVGNPLMNQTFGGHVYNYNNYLVNHEDPNKRNQSFNNNPDNNTNVDHSASTSGSRGYPSTNHMINNKCVF